MKPLLLVALLLLAVPAAAQTPLASPGHPGWTRTTEGCFVWNPVPQVGETVSWSGGCTDSRASGKGVLNWRSSKGTQRFEGEMRNGNYNGRGVVTFENGNRYDGEWRDDKPSGRGVYTWTDGSVFDGEWRDAKPHGPGRMTWANGTIYNGIWTNGCFRDGNRRAALFVEDASCP